MLKPITIRRDEFRNTITTILNNSDLPAFCMVDILEDAVRAVRDLQFRQEEEERKQWSLELKKKENEKEKNPGVEKSKKPSGKE